MPIPHPEDAAGQLAAGISTTTPTTTWTPPSPEALAGVVPQLEIQTLLGRGGMGAVYRARQIHLDRIVAVKVLAPERSADPAFAERFAREARALARLQHPHIVTLYDFGRAGDWHYLVMELVEGATLRQVLATGRLSPHEALRLAGSLCDALAHAHAQGVVHRDLKPENILIDGGGRPKIADFGLAKLHATATDLTQTGETLGTLHYMAPEQVAGAADVDHRADLYALGVIIYELLTGSLPLGRFAPPSQAGADRRLDEVVLKSLEREPGKRWQSAAELGQAMAGVDGRADPQHPQTLANSEAGDHRLLRSGMWMLVGGILLVVWLAYTHASNATPSRLEILTWGSSVAMILGGISLLVRRGLVVGLTGGIASLLIVPWCWQAHWAIGLTVILIEIDMVLRIFHVLRLRRHYLPVSMWWTIGVVVAPVGLGAALVIRQNVPPSPRGQTPSGAVETASVPSTWGNQRIPTGATLQDGALVVASTTGTRVVIADLDASHLTSLRYHVRTQVRWRGVVDKAYLEMWSHFPEGGAYFSRTLGEGGPMGCLTGNSDVWRDTWLIFDATGAMGKPKHLQIAVVLPGAGTVEVRPLELVDDWPAGLLQP